MFDWFNKLPPFAQKIVSNTVTGLIVAGLGILAAAGIYKPTTIVVQPAEVRTEVIAPEGFKLTPATAK